MAGSAASKSSEIRSRLNHPVIDSDGHTVEFLPGFFDVLRTVAGQRVAGRYLNQSTANSLYGSVPNLAHWFALTPEQRRKPARATAAVVGAADAEHPRPRDGDAAEADVPAPG